MSTKYQVQVKVAPKSKADAPLRESVGLAPALNKDPGASRGVRMPPRGSQKIMDARMSEANDVSWSTSQKRSRVAEAGYAVAKRVFDLVLGSILLIIAVPIILVAAIAIRVNSPGSPFFFQTRIGKNGKPFKIFKLRGMYIDARARFPSYYDYSAKRDLEFCFHHENDPRVTRAGTFIRKTSIDELPNLWNVVLGDVSLVGPRPEIPEMLALYGHYRSEYLSVKPGITCLSKCTGRDRLTKRETIEFDIDYVRTRSFSLDFKILWRTFRGVILRRDVF
jgi:lipopolysaccharide/colanic/teichoic acid biosynthesis glycosyltransferase